MAGYNLKEGKLKKVKGKDANKQLWVVIASLFSNKSKKNTTYKFIFLKSILDNLYNAEKTNSGMRISFDVLFRKFTEICWNLVVIYGLYNRKPYNDGAISLVERKILELANEFKVPRDGIRFESLECDKKERAVKVVTNEAKRYVVGAVYGDTRGYFYSFSKRESMICIGFDAYTILCEHKLILEKANYFEWAKFLETINEDNNTDKLLNHLDESGKRKSLGVYREILEKEFSQKECFYCGKKLTNKNTEVDHFIPWSFVKNDNIWNFVLSCRNCNNQKRDKLPSRKYLNRIENRNAKMNIEIETNQRYSKGYVSRIYKFAEDNGYNEYWSK